MVTNGDTLDLPQQRPSARLLVRCPRSRRDAMRGECPTHRPSGVPVIPQLAYPSTPSSSSSPSGYGLTIARREREISSTLSSTKPPHVSSRTIERTSSTAADGPRSGTGDFGGAGSISTTSGFLAALALDLGVRLPGDRCRLSSVSVNDGRVSPTANAISPCSVTVNPTSSRCGSPRLFACTPSKTLRNASRMGISWSLSSSTSTHRRVPT